MTRKSDFTKIESLNCIALSNSYCFICRSELLATTQTNALFSRTKYTFPKIPPEDEKFIIRSPYNDVEIPEKNLADFVWQNVDKWPENVALVSHDSSINDTISKTYFEILVVRLYKINSILLYYSLPHRYAV